MMPEFKWHISPDGYDDRTKMTRWSVSVQTVGETENETSFNTVGPTLYADTLYEALENFFEIMFGPI